MPPLPVRSLPFLCPCRKQGGLCPLLCACVPKPAYAPVGCAPWLLSYMPVSHTHDVMQATQT